MSRAVTLETAPASGLFARFLAMVDNVLNAQAAIAARNGDQPRFGL